MRIDKTDEVFAYWCDCGDMHTINIPKRPNTLVRTRCKRKVILEWDGTSFQIIRETLPLKSITGKKIRKIDRLSFGGDLCNYRFLWSTFGIPLRIAIYIRVAIWKWKCKHFGWRPITDRPDFHAPMCMYPVKNDAAKRKEIFKGSFQKVQK